MGFRIEEGNIVDYKVDAIVNSLGIGDEFKTYGGICHSIVKAANSASYKSKIDNAKEIYLLGDIFITDHYGLPCQNIINIVSPYFDHDHDYKIYKDCVRRILVECVRNNFKTIAIPSFGGGANGYDSDITSEIIKNICTEFCSIDAYHSFDIVLVRSTQQIRRDNRMRLDKDLIYRPQIVKTIAEGSERYFSVYKPPVFKPKTKEYFKPNNYFGNDIIYGPSNIHSTSERTVLTYVKKFCKDKYGSNAEDYYYTKAKAYLKYGNKNPSAEGSKLLSSLSIRSDIRNFYKIIFALHMSFNEANGFLLFFGRAFSVKGFDEENDLVVELLKEQIYDPYQINERFAEKLGRSNILFFKKM